MATSKFRACFGWMAAPWVAGIQAAPRYFAWMAATWVAGSQAAPLLAADPKIHPLPVNSSADEDLPYYNTGSVRTVLPRLYFSRKSVSGKWDLYWARYDLKKKQLGSAELIGPSVQTDADDLGAYVTREGAFPQFMVYATKRDKYSPTADIYLSVREGEDRVFGPLRAIESIATKEDESEPWIQFIDRKTLHLYFVRKTKEGARVFLSVGESDGKEGIARFGIGKAVESIPVGYTHPTLFPGAKRMLLQGPVKGGAQGIYITHFAEGKWSPPKLIEQLHFADARVGSVSPSLTRDGQYLYFASDKSGGKGGLDLYWVQVSELTLPK